MRMGLIPSERAELKWRAWQRKIRKKVSALEKPLSLSGTFHEPSNFFVFSPSQQEGSALASPAAQTKAGSRNNALRRKEEEHMQTLCGPFSYFTCSGLLGSLQPNHCSRSSKVQTALKPQTPGSDRAHTATDSSENALCLHASAAPEMVSKPLCGQESGDHYHSVGMNQTQSMVCLFFC